MRVHRLIQIGAGGIGQFFGPTAARILRYSQDEFRYIIIDGDRYEESNGSRQIGPVGCSKAGYLAGITEGVDSIQEFIEDENHFAQILANDGSESVPQIVAICVDNDATRRFIYRGIEETACPTIVIDMANEEHHGDILHTIWHGAGWLPSSPFDLFPQLKEPGDRPPQAYCQTQAPSHPQLITTNMQAACIGARMLWQILAGNEKAGGPLPVQVTFDHRTWDMRNPDA